MTTFDPIAAIERDVASHNRLRAWIGPLGLTSVALACALGSIVGTTVSMTLFYVNAATAPALALIALGGVCTGVALWARRLRMATRWLLGFFALVIATLWKYVLIGSDIERLASFGTKTTTFGHEVNCFTLGLAASAVMATIVLGLHRRFKLAPSAWARTSGALIAGGAGIVAQGIYCADILMHHLLLAHLGQALIGAAIVVGGDAYLARRWPST